MNRQTRRASQFKRSQRYDRNRVEPSAVLKPVIMSRTFDADEAAKISVDTRMAWHRLTHGEGTESDFDLVANTSNIALVRAEALGELAVETVLRAQASILQMHDRYRRTRRFGADDQALQTVPEMLDFYDQILEHSSPQMMLQALDATVRRMAVLREGGRV